MLIKTYEDVRKYSEIALAQHILSMGEVNQYLSTYWIKAFAAILAADVKIPDLNRILEQAQVNMFFTLWNRLGCPTFNLSQSLCAALILTDSSSIRHEDARFPFDAFVINLPSPSPIKLHTDGKIHDARMITLLRSFVPTSKDRGRMLNMSKYAVEAYLQRDVDRAIRINERLIASVEWKPMLNVRVVPEGGGPSIWHSFPEPADMHESVEDWLLSPESNLANDSNPSELMSEEDANALKTALRVLVNTCLYLRSLTPDASMPKPDRSGMRNEHDITVKPVAWDCGNEIKLPKEMRDTAKKMAAEGLKKRKSSVGWSLRSQFTVRGHFRPQAYGKKHSLRRIQWIAPYDKGPEDAKKVAHLYKVGK